MDATPKLRRFRKGPWLGAMAILLAYGLLLAYKSYGWTLFSGSVNQLSLDLRAPDALVRTQRLGELPRDLFRVPLLKDALPEEALFYYEQHADALGLRGSLRRIAYEHTLQWNDKVLQHLLNEPAEVALWRAPDGTLKHFVISMRRNALARMVQEAATIAGKDNQLKLVAEMRIAGDKVPLLSLDYAAGQTLLIAARGDRLVVFSNPGMLLDDERRIDGDAAKVLAELLGEKEHTAYYAKQFGLQGYDRHSVLVRAHYLSFGYQRFFPGFEALRFDFGAQGWSTWAQIDGGKLPAGALADAAIWQALPYNPALCAKLPVAWAQQGDLLGKLFKPEQTKQLIGLLQGSGAACWYSQSAMSTPLFAVHLPKAKAELQPLLSHLYAWSVGSRDPQQPVVPADAEQGTSGEQRWSKEVATPAGAQQPTLALHRGYALFSPDQELVNLAIKTLDKKYPAAADRLGEGVTLALIAPADLGELLRKETVGALPAAQEPYFAPVAEQHLLPRYAKLKKYPPVRLVMTPAAAADKSRGWRKLDWQNLKSGK